MRLLVEGLKKQCHEIVVQSKIWVTCGNEWMRETWAELRGRGREEEKGSGLALLCFATFGGCVTQRRGRVALRDEIE